MSLRSQNLDSSMAWRIQMGLVACGVGCEKCSLLLRLDPMKHPKILSNQAPYLSLHLSFERSRPPLHRKLDRMSYSATLCNGALL